MSIQMRTKVYTTFQHHAGTKSNGAVADICRKREKKVTGMLILMVVAFNVSWSPYAIMCVFEVFLRHSVPPLWKIPVLLLAKRCYYS